MNQLKMTTFSLLLIGTKSRGADTIWDMQFSNGWMEYEVRNECKLRLNYIDQESHRAKSKVKVAEEYTTPIGKHGKI